MNRNHIAITASVIAATLIAALMTIRFSGISTTDSEPPSSVHIRYSFLLKNNSNEPLVDSRFSLFGPRLSSPSQNFTGFTASTPMEAVMDDHENLVFVANGLTIPPFGSKNISLTVSLDVHSKAPPSKVRDIKEYLGDEDYLNMSSPHVIEAARKFSQLEKKETPFAIYNWLIDNIESTGYVAQARGAEAAIRERKGDCTEFMHAFIALARLNGIPARPVGGFVLESDAALVRSHEYHNWAEFYQDGRWIIADPQKQIIGDPVGKHYITFRYLSDQSDTAGFSQRFLSFDPRLSVQMM